LISVPPSLSHVKSSEAGAAILIVAPSGRALAAAARRAGYRPLVADFFDDADTRILAAANRRIAGDLQSGFDGPALIAVLETLANGSAPIGLVYGAGFEDRAELLDDLARRWALFGNPAEVVRKVKDPIALAALCTSLNIPHPEISAEMPEDSENWLVKSVGGSGGSHIARAQTWQGGDEPIYFQRIARGDPVSLLLLADGTNAQVLGASRQWPTPTRDEPFRFGGSLRPAGLSSGLEERLTRLAVAMVRACALRGLNSIDLLVEDEDFTLLEINPRPGATLDIFEDRDGLLFQAHLDACLGRLPERPLRFDGAAAAGIAYARRPIASMPQVDWPYWASDHQKAQSALQPHDPLCTVKARAASPRRARMLMDQRTNLILDKLDRL
jgi:predicted ATP-grasp superfamily ATP-dependent carboligase